MTNEVTSSSVVSEATEAESTLLVDNGGAGGNESMQVQHGSSLPAAIFNFTNSIVGAGAIGLGGAIALSGGFISIALILFFGILTKISLDLVIRLSVETEGAHGSYEDLALMSLGTPGRLVVLFCKLAYSFGCLVAYTVVIKDNMAPAIRHMIYGDESESNSWFRYILSSNVWFTWLISCCCILPLCLLRDMTPLAKFSVVSVLSMIMIVGIVIYIFFDCPEVRQPGGTFYENWLQVRPGALESLGTFVFTFVSQHTVHLVFSSMKPDSRTVANWRIVSSFSLLIATVVSLSVGLFVYATFWQHTKSDIFEIYPHTWMIDVAKLLLCTTMILTFPLPFFTSRELLIVTFVHPFCGIDPPASETDPEHNIGMQEPLLGDSSEVEHDYREIDTLSIVTDVSRLIMETATPKNWLLPDDDRQLQLPGHIARTVKLWIVTTGFAIAAPSLGDVLDLVGCATGTIIAFVLPALISFRVEGYSHQALVIFAVGGIVGTVGTYFSVAKLFSDLYYMSY